MQGRNPFTSISNYSFVRNAHHFSSSRPPSRSYSGSNKYSDYQGMYLRDSYLLDIDERKKKETVASKFLGVESLRYELPPAQEIVPTEFQSTGEYYNTQVLSTPLPTLPLSSDFQNSAMKSSTKDMFSSDYFSKREAADSREDEDYQIQVKKPSVFKKQGNINSRFKQTVDSNPIDQVMEKSQTNIDKSESVKSKSSRTIMSTEQFGDPETIYLKSRKTLFFRYHSSYQEEQNF